MCSTGWHTHETYCKLKLYQVLISWYCFTTSLFNLWRLHLCPHHPHHSTKRSYIVFLHQSEMNSGLVVIDKQKIESCVLWLMSGPSGLNLKGPTTHQDSSVFHFLLSITLTHTFRTTFKSSISINVHKKKLNSDFGSLSLMICSS